ncbi:MAG: RelA/SpoT family protein, partial [Alphaproteobacteria bacterium]
MMRQQELVERVLEYDPDCNEALLNKAYVFAMRAHGNDKRHSGDPYFSHPIEVAGILTDLKLDTASVTTALLHDTVEDTLATSEQIHQEFGAEVGALVDGVTKLSKLELSGEGAQQAQNFRKLLIAMSKDIRVLLVKLADRLHNMRTLHFHPKEASRRRIAQETMEIFAPLAGRIGMQEIREELEDLAFANLNPEAREGILKRLEFLQTEAGESISRILETVEQTLSAKGVIAKVDARQKRAYSIWRKMQVKDITFEQLADIHAFRIMVEDEETCYRVLGIVHGAWPVVPGRFKDFISNPKRNGYRSLHTTVIGPERQRAEFQIRSHAMHEVAEKGLAAHWRYKEMASLFDEDEAGQKPVPESEAQAYRWLRGLVEMIEHGSDNADEDLEHTKMELFLDQVFCFTPKGAVIVLPKGATAIDFAYAVHTDVGDTCVGCKINGRRLPIRHRVRNGDQVEIIRSRTQKPSPAWEHIAITGKARAAIRRHVRADKRAEHIKLGREVLEQAAAAENVKVTDKGLDDVASRFQAETRDDLLEQIGSGEAAGSEVLYALYPALKIKAGALRLIGGVRPKEKADAKAKRQAIAIRGLTPGLSVHYAPCCHPLPGDRIVGVMAQGRGVIVHTIDCERLGAESDAEQSEWLDLSWQNPDNSDDAMMAVGRVRILV